MKKNNSMKKTQTKIVKFYNSKANWIYEVIDPDTKHAFYAGQTTDLKRRGNQHAKSKYKINELLKLKNVRFKDVVRVVPELPQSRLLLVPINPCIPFP